MSDSSTSSAELWAEITAMPRPSRVVEFPRKKPDGTAVGEFLMQVLTQEEQMLSSAAAERFTKKMIGDAPKSDEVARGYNDVYTNEAAVQILFRACRSKDDLKKPLFPAVEALRQNLSNDEIGTLMNFYYVVQSELGPVVAGMTEAEMDAFVARIIEGGSSYPLGSLSWEVVTQLLSFLASLRYSSLMSKSSPLSPPVDSETST
jgi:hypothetical protein